MYESYFRFEKPPFKVVPDPSMLFASHSVREALGRLEFAVRTGKGITVMTGEVGTGKTTLINRFLDKAGSDTQTAYIFNPTLSGLQLLKTLADELGVQTQGMAKVDLTRALYEHLLRNRQAGRRTIVFVDEAQALSREALEELRLISNLETWQEKLLHLFLVGQPELLDKLESFNLRQLRQRVELFVRIEPMTAAETRQYIVHRLRLANPLREVGFTDGACQLVHEIAGGIPRMINIVCDASLLVAYVGETGTVTPRHVREAVHTIDGGQVSLRMGRRRRRRFWRRFWVGAAAVLGAVVLGTTIDSDRLRTSLGGQPTLAPRSGPVAVRPLVHVHSAPTAEEAARFVARTPPPAGHVIYLQRVAARDRTWNRVLVGDFTDLNAARNAAGAFTASGRYPYARAVGVPENELLREGGLGSDATANPGRVVAAENGGS
jgi:type II secretory pathway predicted ATPase ExeA